MKNFKELSHTSWAFIHEDNFSNLSSKTEELSKMLSSFYSKINSKPPNR